MPALKVMGFDGIVPRTSPTMLQDSQGQQADNVKLYSRELRYWKGATLEPYVPQNGVVVGGSSIQSLYKYYYGTGSSYLWFAWTTDVNAVSSPMADLTDYRLYYTDGTKPKKTNYTLATTGSGPYPRSSKDLGVPAPTTAPTVAGTSFTITGFTTTDPGHSYTVGDVIKVNGGTFTTQAQFTVTSVDANSNTGPLRNVNVTTPGSYTVLPPANSQITNVTGTGSDARATVVSGTVESRAYVYTYLSTFGAVTEESAPSPASSVINVQSSVNSVTVNGIPAFPAGNYNFTGVRIYRTVTGATTDSYQFVTEITTSTPNTISYTDTKTSAQLGNNLGTIGWVPPPDALTGLISHPSGSLVGFVNNTLYFSEPYYPHAWPISYAINVPSKIISLGVFGTSIVVTTDRYPYIITGAYPGGMSVERVPILEPCVSKQSTVSDEFGVVYASPNGLVGIGPAMRGVITKDLFAYNEWIQYSPQLISGAIVNNQYFATYPTITDSQKTFVFNRGDIPALSRVDMPATAVHVDSKGGNVYYVDGITGRIYKWDDDELNPLRYDWKSKRWVLPQATTFSVIKLDGDYDQIANASGTAAAAAAIAARNQTAWAANSNLLGAVNTGPLNASYYDTATATYRGITVNGSILEDIPTVGSTRSVAVEIYGDGVLKTTLNMTSFDPVRIPPFKSRAVEVSIQGNINIRSIKLATTQVELRE
jgi:hypothetical protein